MGKIIALADVHIASRGTGKTFNIMNNLLRNGEFIIGLEMTGDIVERRIKSLNLDGKNKSGGSNKNRHRTGK